MSVSDQKKKQIVEAAIAEFQEKGYAGASMDRISERAQVSKRTVYNHFESKDVLFRAINQCLADQINSALELPYDPDLPIRDALVRLGWAEGELMINPCFMSRVHRTRDRRRQAEGKRSGRCCRAVPWSHQVARLFPEYLRRARTGPRGNRQDH